MVIVKGILLSRPSSWNAEDLLVMCNLIPLQLMVVVAPTTLGQNSKGARRPLL